MKSKILAMGLAALSLPQVLGARSAPDPLDRALALSDEQQAGFIHLCDTLNSPKLTPGPKASELMAMPIPAPAKAFDNLYFVGSRWTNSWALTTSKGIILLDAMDNDDEAQHIIVDGLRKLGLDPTTIRYVIVSHGHSDHYGGASYIKRLSGARIVMSDVDWTMLEHRPADTRADRGSVPTRDISVKSGDRVTLGDTNVEIYATPGHTMGTISSIFDVHDHGVRHRAILWGGSSFNFGKAHPEQLTAYLETARAAPVRIRDEKIDVLVSNHPEYDRSVVKFGKLQANGGKPNPFVIGVPGVLNAAEVMEQCGLATAKVWETPLAPDRQ